MFRLVWQISEDDTGNESSVTSENIWPEVLVSLKSFWKIFRDAYVEFYDWKSYLQFI